MKFKTECETRLARQIQTKSPEGCVQTGIPSIDKLNIDYEAIEMRPLFSSGGKYAERRKKHGLHLWYELRFREEQKDSVELLISKYGADVSIQVAEPVYNKTMDVTSNVNLRPKYVKSDKLLYSPFLPSKRTNWLPNDPLFGQQWHYHNTGQTGGTADADINLPEAWELEKGGREVIVSVHDQGIDFLHEDLAANMWINEAEQDGEEGVDDDGNGIIDDIYGYNFVNNTGTIEPGYHGTHVAGTVAAVTNNGIGVAGIAGGSNTNDGVRLMSCQVFTDLDGGGFAESYAYAADNGAVISQNSWGYTRPGDYEQAILDAIDYFIANAGYDHEGNPTGPMQGGLVVCAAANDDEDEPYYPAYYEPVLAVAATNHQDQKAWYSNYGSWVDIAAPGGETNNEDKEGVLSTLPGNQYGYLQGTSMACPHVSGVAGLIVSKFGKTGYSPFMVRARLTETSDDINATNPDFQHLLGKGRMNAHYALFEAEIAPERITDLQIAELYHPQKGTTFTWNAPADQDNEKANHYEIRYSEEPITAGNYGNARILESNLPAKETGSPESYSIKNLNFGETYFFAIKSVDFFGNISGLSNVLSVTLPDPPIISTTPLTLTSVLTLDADEVQKISISNQGAADLMVNLDPLKLRNKRIGFLDTFGFYDELISNIEFRGGQVTALSFEDIKEGIPSDLDLIIFDRKTTRVSQNEVLLIREWVREGGSLLIAGNKTQTSLHNHLLAGSGIEVAITRSSSDSEYSNFSRHEIIRNVGSIKMNSFDYTNCKTSGSAYPLAWDTQDNIMSAVSHLGQGNVLFVSEPFEDSFVSETEDNLRFANQAVDWLVKRSSSWMETPIFGTIVPSGEERFLDVHFDAENILGGSYEATIVVTSNDPAQSETLIPVTLAVTGTPSLMSEVATLEFGEGSVSHQKTATIKLQNTGTTDLVLNNLTIDEPAFSSELSTLTIAPGREADLTIFFLPEEVKSYLGKVSFTTNDPIQELFEVTVSGEGVLPPEILIDPLFLTSNLITNESETQQLRVINQGNADLSVQLECLDLQNLKIGFFNSTYYHGDVFINDLKERAGEVINLENFLMEKEIIDELDLIIFLAGSNLSSPDEIQVIRNWIYEGGSVLLTGKNFNPLLEGSGMEIIPKAVSGVRLTNLAAHPITYGIDSIILPDTDFAPGQIRWPYAAVCEVSGEAIGLVLDEEENAFAAASQMGEGRILYASGVLSDLFTDIEANRQFVNRSIEWLVNESSRWLTIPVSSISVPPGESRELDIQINATDVFDGVHESVVFVSSNDPVTNHVNIPVTLTVTGIPALDTDSILNFGPVFTSQRKQIEVSLQNIGTADLTISDIVTNHPAFTLASFTDPVMIAPGRELLVAVSFEPQLPQSYDGVLTVYSDDPETPEYEISASGEGLLPPEMLVEPLSLTSSLFSLDSETQQLTISNNGNSDLNIQLAPLELRGIKVGFFARTGFNESMLYSSIASKGAKTIHLNDHPISKDLLDTLDVIIFESLGEISSEELSLIQNWASEGGGLLVTEHSNVAVKNELLTGSGIEVLVEPPSGDLFSNLLNHPVTNGVEFIDVWRLYTNSCHVSGEAFALEKYGSTENIFTAASHLDSGRVIFIGEYVSDDEFVAIRDNLRFVTQCIDWLARRVSNWLTLPVTSATIPRGESIVLDVVFDATYLVTDRYESGIIVSSNDPLRPETIIPVTLDVTGVPSMKVPEETIDFGEVMIRETKTKRIPIQNRGTEVLHITEVKSRSNAFEILEWGAEVQPSRYWEFVEVAFFTEESGTFTGALEILSNDPSSPSTIVQLTGTALSFPILSMDKDYVNFGEVVVGETKQLTVTIENKGTETLLIEDIQVSGDVFTPLSWDTEIQPNDSKTFTIAFSPDNKYSKSIFRETLRVISNDPNNPTEEINLRGIGVPQPKLVLESEMIDFDEVALGKSRSVYVHIKNEGSDYLLVNEISSNNENFEIVSAVNLIIPGQSNSIEVRFTPDQTGEATAEMEIESNDANNPIVRVQLTGVGVRLPEMVIDDTPLDFGEVEIGNSVSLQVPIKNQGTEVLEITDIYTLTGLDNPFEVASYDAAIQPDATGLVTIHFTPVLPQSSSGRLVIESNDPYKNAPVQIVMNGRGEGPKILLEETSIDFDDVVLSKSKSMTLPVKNEGSKELHLTSIESDNEQFRVTEPELFVQPGQEELIHLTFTPDEDNYIYGTLNLQSNDVIDPETTVSLKGRGIALPEIIIEDQTIDFGEVVVFYETKRVEIPIENQGTSFLNVFLVSSNNERFEIRDWDGIIQPKQTGHITIAFRTSLSGAFSGDIEIQSNDPISPSIKVQVEAIGITPADIEIEEGEIIAQLTEGTTISHALEINNLGENDLELAMEIDGNPDWIQMKNIPDIIKENNPASLTLDFNAPDKGVYQTNLNIFTNDPGKEQVEIPIKLIVCTGNNENPLLVKAFEPEVMFMYQGNSFELNDHFSSSEPDPLHYEVVNKSEEEVRVVLAESTVHIHPLKTGLANVEITTYSNCGELSLSYEFTIDEYCNGSTNQKPILTKQLEALTLAKGKSITVNMEEYMTDPDDNAPLTYEIELKDNDLFFATLNGTNLTITALNEGQTSLSIVATDIRCGQLVIETTVSTEIITGMDLSKPSLVYYPNPANQNLHVKIRETPVNHSMSIWDLTGKQIVKPFHPAGKIDGEEVVIDVSGLKDGSYLLEIEEDKQSKWLRFHILHEK